MLYRTEMMFGSKLHSLRDRYPASRTSTVGSFAVIFMDVQVPKRSFVYVFEPEKQWVFCGLKVVSTRNHKMGFTTVGSGFLSIDPSPVEAINCFCLTDRKSVV